MAFLTAVLVAAHPAAAAPGESVSMAYACRLSANQVHLDPSSERTYRILGKREAQTLRVCSGSAAASCRTLEIHRFTIECDGNVVQWIDAAAAAIRGQPWRATFADGRMTLHYWPDGPTKHARLPLTLPAGFAPAPASGWRFEVAEAVASDSAGAASSPSLAQARTSRRSEAETAQPAIPVSDPSPIQFVVQRPSGDAAIPSITTASTLGLPMGQGWSATVVVGDEAGGTWWSPLAIGDGSQGMLAVIGLVALLLSATAVAARQHLAPRIPGPVTPRSANDTPALENEVSAQPKAMSPPPPPLPRTIREPDVADHVTELASALAATSAPTSRTSSEWDAVIEMRTTAEALLELVRQMIADHVPEGALRDVLIADVDAIYGRLDGSELATALAQARLDLVHPVYAQAILDLERVRTLARIEHQRALETVGVPHRPPETIEEACAFLGINPRAGQPVVKKVVDALRQNWHPDLADDEADRRVREDRIKRINAAWDLIRAR